MRADESLGVGDAPDTDELARLLEVEGEYLRQFAAHHPDPSAEHILAWCDGDEAHAPQVAAWLRKFKSARRRRYERYVGGGTQ